jgi:hypothetical protein
MHIYFLGSCFKILAAAIKERCKPFILLLVVGVQLQDKKIDDSATHRA